MFTFIHHEGTVKKYKNNAIPVKDNIVTEIWAKN